MTNSALDIAKYVINRSIELGHPVSHLKLQKLLYYIQANCLVNLHKECFLDPIENWQYGPVVPTVYHEFKSYGYKNIEEKQDVSNDIQFNKDTFELEIIRTEFDDKIIPTEMKKLIDTVLDSYKSSSAVALVIKTHSEAPWLSTSNGAEISSDLIKEYYSKNPSRLLSTT